MINKLGKNIPEQVDGLGKLQAFQGAFEKIKKGVMEEPTVPAPNRAKMPHQSKLVDTLKEAIEKCNPKDGLTISFHHHLRGGDEVLVPVMNLLANMGIKDITLASSSLTGAHDPVVPLIENGTITRIFSSGIRNELGKAISHGKLKHPVVIHSHGGRVRDVHTGRISVDIAVIATSAADCEGNATGSHGPSAFGSLGYAAIDARYAKNVIVVTDNLVDFPCLPPSITQNFVDHVVKVDSIGDAKKIATGTTRITKSPMDLHIAKVASDAIVNSGYFKNGISFQVGAGGASLAVARFIREEMKKKEIKGSYLLGGVTSYLVDMLEEGFFDALFDVQSFDAAVSRSLYENNNHVEISGGMYANPYNCGCLTNKLDVVVLGALEIDTDFNVNVITGSDGEIRGASGGHSDTAAGANLTVVVCPSFRGRIPIVKKQVNTIVTPGETVDILVTERGLCVNPAKPELEKNLKEAGLWVRDIKELEEEVRGICGEPKKIEYTDKIVGLVEYRDGSIIDVIYEVKNKE
ncbi:citrate lyase subunit alpha/citrate CoA-transferase [Balneicella halophila]|uniref:Citrate lyase alpha chain n=1 Tax=Balneicella halophila TaxID=1537566 RepID=A0A7L4UP02_BALHA|nr:citrate lyase subunit alpha [Balneicella halophila]PVX49403.1 citrate lyase subunit alpha/citrate CoA-transferase [Balneicella halophila]